MKQIMPIDCLVVVDEPMGSNQWVPIKNHRLCKFRGLKLLIVDPAPIGIQHKLVILEAAAMTVALLHRNRGIPFHLCPRLLCPARANGSNERQDQQHGRILWSYGCYEKPGEHVFEPELQKSTSAQCPVSPAIFPRQQQGDFWRLPVEEVIPMTKNVGFEEF